MRSATASKPPSRAICSGSSAVRAQRIGVGALIEKDLHQVGLAVSRRLV